MLIVVSCKSACFRPIQHPPRSKWRRRDEATKGRGGGIADFGLGIIPPAYVGIHPGFDVLMF